jgi:hypothetical protein
LPIAATPKARAVLIRFLRTKEPIGDSPPGRYSCKAGKAPRPEEFQRRVAETAEKNMKIFYK